MSKPVRLPAGRTLRYEVALNGWKILRDTINDFSLWRLIEYPWCTDALDLKRGVFKLTSAKKIAASLKRSAEHSSRRKTGAYRSALSMLTFYINRAGKNLPKAQLDRLQRAKVELKHQFGRE